MTEDRPKALVLGSDTRSFLSTIRSLGRRGVEVHVAWCARDSVSVRSKYVHSVHSPLRPPSGGWVEEFEALLQREQFDLVIPCNDPSILPLHQERQRFSDHRIYLIDEGIFDTVMDKAEVNRIASAAGLRLPREAAIRGKEDFDALNQITPPYVLKPTQSYVSSNLGQKNHVAILPEKQSAVAAIDRMLRSTPVAVQEYFEGVGVGVEFIARDGRVLSAFQHQRLHEPPGGGGSSYRKSCKLDPELAEATEALVGALGYTGIGMAEFKYNPTSRDWIFVELNSRFWGSLPLAVNCGADFPAYLFDMLCNGREDFPRDCRENQTCRNWLLDLKWLQKTASANGTSLRRHAALAWQLICELRYPMTLRESSDTFNWDDPQPAIRELTDSAGAIPRRIRRKLSKKALQVPALRRRARRHLLGRISAAQHVLFVCKGNICRSPFAQRYALTKLRHVRHIRSSGYYPKQSRPSPENAQTAASQFGVDLGDHRSSVLSQEMVDDADLILVFDEENRDEIGSRYPRAKAKTYLLGTLLDDADAVITDPYGGSVEGFHSIYTKITRALDGVPN
ncbi:Low molecular weight protein-tyrosine-phosphatase etp [Stieleria maiorica]|uniref:protein-tyrosine-phosphatase n=1 Tax=Stieleria maiorica TaxID=2795974 RepID=A0A5B9MFK6_9BACT|nr:hypothetical protein [Stieleria maiorica]QEF99623.1 Low molecular weight protein-tyrosine-phosphatase etp [Stieleria maiorica]